MASLDPHERQRYARQIRVKEIGVRGQERLKSTAVLIVGVGGLGCPAGLYLAAAGVGRIGLIDDDVVDETNLQRQVLYSTDDVGKKKATVAGEKLRRLNPHIAIETFDFRLTTENAAALFEKYDIILDGSDNFSTRYLVNDAAYFAGKPFVSGSVLGFEAQVATFAPGDGCYRCLYGEPPPPGAVDSCAVAGVLGTMPGIVGTIQAQEAMMLSIRIGESLKGKLLMIDGLSNDYRKLEVGRDVSCRLCGSSPSIRNLTDTEASCAHPNVSIEEISYAGFAERRAQIAGIQVLDVREPDELINEGTLEPSHHIPLGDLGSRHSELKLETPVLVYCRSGGRSRRACELLVAKGYRAINLLGGIQSKPRR